MILKPVEVPLKDRYTYDELGNITGKIQKYW